ncbi:hypothetical protein [Tenacibaculum amylolyticum]|uniref:hypothetical protein n=1 Tax=Tenacibaculum amylolyticum TaxID=104269 RepID=UPI003893232C
MRAKAILILQSLLVTFIVSFMSLKSFGQQTVTVNKNKHYSYSSKNNGVHKIQFNGKGGDFQVEFEGDITLSDDDKDITAISRGGFIEIKKSSFGKKRKIVIEAESGTLKKRYYVGWNEKPFIPDGKEWLGEVLPEIVRNTTIAAESRVNRFYSRGGAQAVLNEIKRLGGDYVTAKYFSYLLEKDLSNSELTKVIETAGKQVDSDYYLAQILQSNQRAFLASPQTVSAYINATKNVGSDYYMAQVLTKAIKNDDISDDQLGELLVISKDIGSDYYMSQLLIKILNNRKLNKANMNKIMQLSNEIGSDYYKSQVLKKALDKKDLSKENYKAFISSIDDIDSDYYASGVIADLLGKDLDNAALNRVLKLVSENVASDYYASSVYKKIAAKKLNEEQLIIILNSLDNIGSSNYLSSALVAFAPKVKRSSQRVKDAYMKRAKSINSDTYYGRAVKAMY